MSTRPLCIGQEDHTLKRYIVWICNGCDRCDPPDGSPRVTGPCTDSAPSLDGADVVRTADLLALIASLRLHDNTGDPWDGGYMGALDDVATALDAREATDA